MSTSLVESCGHSEGASGSVETLKRIIRQMSPDRAAEIIVEGMLRKKRRILVGRDAKVLDLVVRLFPAGYDRIVHP